MRNYVGSGRGSIPTGKWIVGTHGEPGKAFEIFVAREDNKWAWESWGWCNQTSKFMVSHNGGPCQDTLNTSLWYLVIAAAEQYADHLNAADKR